MTNFKRLGWILISSCALVLIPFTIHISNKVEGLPFNDDKCDIVMTGSFSPQDLIKYSTANTRFICFSTNDKKGLVSVLLIKRQGKEKFLVQAYAPILGEIIDATYPIVGGVVKPAQETTQVEKLNMDEDMRTRLAPLLKPPKN